MAVAGCALSLCSIARADDAISPAPQTSAPAQESCNAKRPVVMFNRWQEDWSVLKNPCVPREPLDGLKYIPLGSNPDTYLSLGANLRERVEVSESPLFGLSPSARSDTYLIQRAQVSADARIDQNLQLFVQLEDARPFDKDVVRSTDKNPLDLEQAFAAWVSPLGPGTVKLRIGRQEMAFDLQRFISVRDGPNVRQAYDAVWADYEYEKWRFIGYATRPVQYRDISAFDDTSNRHLTFSGVRFERQGVGPGDLSGYYSLYTRAGAQFLDAQGDEHRNVFDLRYTGKMAAADYDVESMYQTGHVGDKTIAAWAVGSLFGCTLASPWTPRLGLQVDAASGDRHPGDGRIGTFNPLFPNGYYFTLAGYTGYANLIHVKPSFTLKPSSKLTLLFAVAFQWRMTVNDAIYQQGSAVVPGTAGRGTRWTGSYAQIRADWTAAPNLIASVEAVHFKVGDSIRDLGGSDSDYVGLEVKYGW
ncbi:alginate export family protein [Pararobbsia alpina]|uniref:alginate export family protein n=1 Tax=Pararobbsia alpina TaxID=621374 RepID=UPI0039A48DB2